MRCSRRRSAPRLIASVRPHEKEVCELNDQATLAIRGCVRLFCGTDRGRLWLNHALLASGRHRPMSSQLRLGSSLSDVSWPAFVQPDIRYALGSNRACLYCLPFLPAGSQVTWQQCGPTNHSSRTRFAGWLSSGVRPHVQGTRATRYEPPQGGLYASGSCLWWCIPRIAAAPVQLSSSRHTLCLGCQPSGSMVLVASSKASRAQRMVYGSCFNSSRHCADRILHFMSRFTAHQAGFIPMRPNISFKPMPLRDTA